MVLVRQHLGGVLRRLRMRQGRTLRDVAHGAQVSPSHLSEIERGRKEASSELLAAICAELDVPLSELLHEVSDELAVFEYAELVRPRVVRSVAAERIRMHADAHAEMGQELHADTHDESDGETVAVDRRPEIVAAA